MLLKTLTVVLFVFSGSHLLAAASDPSIGAQLAVASAQDLLASPPLPRLETGGKETVSPQIGYMSVKVDSDTTSQTTTNESASGTVSGVSGGIGLTSPTNGRTGWFLFAVGSSLTGEVNIIDNSSGSTIVTLKEMKSSVFAAAAGINYRFIGESNTPVAAGFFLGPSYMKVNSSFTPTSPGAPAGGGNHYEMNPNIYGLYGGLQGKLSLGKLILNPYVLFLSEMSGKNKDWTVDGQPATPQLSLSASFNGYGLFLAYGKLRANVYSKAVRSKDYSDITVTNYSLSYTFGLDEL